MNKPTPTSHRTRRITPAQIRTRRFRTRRWGGLDPDEVHAYLEAVAQELATLSRELIITVQENDRIKHALRDWQTRYSRAAHATSGMYTSWHHPSVTWPGNPG
jgi:DivIVA domain-containing protein